MHIVHWGLFIPNLMVSQALCSLVWMEFRTNETLFVTASLGIRLSMIYGSLAVTNRRWVLNIVKCKQSWIYLSNHLTSYLIYASNTVALTVTVCELLWSISSHRPNDQFLPNLNALLSHGPIYVAYRYDLLYVSHSSFIRMTFILPIPVGLRQAPWKLDVLMFEDQFRMK